MDVKCLCRYAAVLASVLVLLCGSAPAAWHEPKEPYRRPLELEREEAKITGEELVDARFLANGKQRPDGRDIRVLTASGKPVPFRVINAGPGDYIDVAFNAAKGIRSYYAYFGNSEGPSSSDKTGGLAPRREAQKSDSEQYLNRGGLLLEMRQYTGEPVSSTRELQMIYDRSRRPIGNRVVQRPFLGVNPFGGQQMSISRISGQLFAPMAGSYAFAIAADDRAGLMIDDKPVVFCRHPVGDTRFQERIQLERGWHDFVIYHADGGGEYVLSVVWRRPDMDRFELIGREFFGLIQNPIIGALEEQNRTLTADAEISYQGESFFAWNYSHRYRFTARTNLRNTERLQIHWTFGDGQSATGAEVEHVYLTAGMYNVTVEARSGANSDTQTFRLPVDRDTSRIENPPTDELGLQARFVSTYDYQKLAPESLAWAVIMQQRAGVIDSAVSAAKALCLVPKHNNRSTAIRTLDELKEELLKRNEAQRMIDILAATPRQSDLNPWAACNRASLLMYAVGDFPAAMETIKPFANSDDQAKRTYGQALILSGQLDEGRRVLEAILPAAAIQKAPALSGAMARSTEYYIDDKKDTQAGEQAWEKWMSTFPADFMDGNSAVMRVRLIESRGHPEVAAKVAEAYANSNAQSAYAPRLLDMASKLLERSDPGKSQSLRKLLKDRYPEDPLGQK